MRMHAIHELTCLLRALRLAIEAESQTMPSLDVVEAPLVEELVAGPAWAFDTPPAADVYMDPAGSKRLAA